MQPSRLSKVKYELDIKNRVSAYRSALRPILFVLVVVAATAGSIESVSAADNDCDKALSIFWKGRYTHNKQKAYRHYRTAIQLCPGFIRPYELLGNLYRNDGQTDAAIALFTQAADLGTTNHKLYYLLASLLFDKGQLDDASRHLQTSLKIKPDYPQALELKTKLDRARDRDGPQIILFEPAARRGIKMVYQVETLSVRGIATDKSGLAWVRINQQDAPTDDRGNFLKDVPIEIGENTLVVEAADSIGNLSRILIRVERKKTEWDAFSALDSRSQLRQVYERSFAVVIGINSYEKWPVLEFAVNDARAIRKTLSETGFDDVTTLFDGEATQRRILSELFHTLPQKVGQNDRVLFYFAGHGQTEELPGGGKRGYIIPVDAEADAYASSAISMDQIRSLSSRIPAKHILYVMDSCYSGLGLSRAYGLAVDAGGYLKKVSAMRAVQIVTAGGKGEQVQERAGHGLFTTYFLRAINGEADINGDNIVTGMELGAYLRPSVSDASHQQQTPLFGRLEGEGEFIFFVGLK
jgi:tetratricopeptide (TPR) repeat protein